MDFREQLAVIWQRRWIILFVSGAITGLVYAWSTARPDVYRAEARLQVMALRSSGDAAEDASIFQARTYAQLIDNDALVADAIERSGLSLTIGQAKASSSADTNTSLPTITISTSAPRAKDAALLANGLAEALQADAQRRIQANIELVLAPLRDQLAVVERELDALPADTPDDNLERQLLVQQNQQLNQNISAAQLRPTTQVEISLPSGGGYGPVAPDPTRDSIFAFLIAFVAAAELMVVLHALDGRFSNREGAVRELERLGLRVMARISSRRGEAAEGYRELRTAIQFLDPDHEKRTIAIVSVEHGAGKSTTAVGLARALAEMGEDVTLVDADLRRPVLHARLNTNELPGLGETLTNPRYTPAECRVEIESHLMLLPSGQQLSDPTGACMTNLESVLDAIPGRYVVIDTPPVGLFVDGAVVSRIADITLFVIDARASKRDDVRDAVRQLRDLGAVPTGVILNRVNRNRRNPYTQPRQSQRRSKSSVIHMNPGRGLDADATRTKEPAELRS